MVVFQKEFRMQLLLPTSIVTKEIKPLTGKFSLATIIAAAQKISSGIGISIRGAPKGSRYFKIPLTGPQGAGRALFLVQVEEDAIIPLLVRDKTDAVGVNMSPKNKKFCDAVWKNLQLALADIKRGDVEVVIL